MSQPDDVIETTILRGKVKLLQPREGFHASTDTVLLAASATPLPAKTVLDVGCGVGSVGLSIALNKIDIRLIGIDIQPDVIDLAARNAALNGMADRARFVLGGIHEPSPEMTALVPDHTFDLVVSNPPFQAGGRHTPSPVAAKAFAHGEDASGVTLGKWCKYMHQKAKNGGYVALVHRADRLDEMINVLTARRWFGSLSVLPVYSRAGDAAAKRVVVTARKERYAPIVLKSGLIMHEADGSYAPAAAEILDGNSFIQMY